MNPDFQPDIDDVLQEEEQAAPLTPIPVVVQGQVRVQDPPAVSLQVGQWALDASVGAQRVLGDDPMRSRVQLTAVGGVVRIGVSQKQVAYSSTCMLLPAGVLLELRARSEIWAAADSGTVTLSGAMEKWTD